MGIRIRSVAVLGLVALLGILWSMSPRTRGAPEAGPRTEVEATRANIEGALPLAGGETAERFRRRAEIESEVLGKLGATSPVRGEDASTPAELGARIAAAAGVRIVVDPASQIGRLNSTAERPVWKSCGMCAISARRWRL